MSPGSKSLLGSNTSWLKNRPPKITSSTLTLTTPTYNYKAGKIVIFNKDNFADWERTWKAALIILEG